MVQEIGAGTRTLNTCTCSQSEISLMVECVLPKHAARVRFPHLALLRSDSVGATKCRHQPSARTSQVQAPAVEYWLTAVLSICLDEIVPN
jgi:hypothetical protein